MSWEVMKTTTGPCACGAGTETHVFEMDDWNRTRSATEFHCPVCTNRLEQEVEVDMKHDERRGQLLRSAQELVTQRYGARWLELFAGMTRKAAWQTYTEGKKYPALGTFYEHIKQAGGLSRYLELCLMSDLKRCLRILRIEDVELDGLLEERARLWKPTIKTM